MTRIHTNQLVVDFADGHIFCGPFFVQTSRKLFLVAFHKCSYKGFKSFVPGFKNCINQFLPTYPFLFLIWLCKTKKTKTWQCGMLVLDRWNTLVRKRNYCVYTVVRTIPPIIGQWQLPQPLNRCSWIWNAERVVRLRAEKSSRYVASHLDQLSLLSSAGR